MSKRKKTKKTKKSKKWRKSRPPQVTKIVSGYGLKDGEMIRGLEEFNKATFSSCNEDVTRALEYTRYTTELNKICKSAYKFERYAGYGRRYPGTPMLDDSFKLADGELEALLNFRSKKPFRASKPDYLDMIQQLFLDLAKVQGHKAPAVIHTGIWEYKKGNTNFYTPHVVVLTGKKSLITALHEYMHSIGYGEVVAVWWSTNAFRIIFPKAFGKLEQHPDYPHLMRRKKPPTEDVPSDDNAPTADVGTTAMDLGD